MSGDGFDDRLARLQEHVVSEWRTAEECLAIAERCIAEGDQQGAMTWLNLAKARRALDRIDRAARPEGTEEDDDA